MATRGYTYLNSPAAKWIGLLSMYDCLSIPSIKRINKDS